jgi:two-component SAPR family response regulator
MSTEPSALATKGDLELGKQHFKAALQIARKDNLSLLSLICDGLAVACIELGQLDQAAVYLEQARAGWLKLGSEGPLAESLTNLALVYYHQGQFDLAFEEVREALRAAQAAGYPRLVATALARQAMVQQALGAYEESLASSFRALEIARDLLDHRLVGESTLDIGNAYRKQGETSKAEVLLKQALLEAQQSGQTYLEAHYHLYLGKAYCQDTSYIEASNHFKLAEEQFRELRNLRRVAEAALYQAAICYRGGKLKEAGEQLEQAARLISKLGYDGFLLADGAEVMDVLRFGVAKRVGGRALTRLVSTLAHRASSHEESANSADEDDRFGRFPTLRAFGFGSPRVVLDCHEVSHVEWRSRKAQELFFYLLCNKRQVNKEELMEALWPETSVNMSESALKTSIYRLRQAVFYECVSAQDAGYRMNPAITVQFDLYEFQKHLRLATEAHQINGEQAEHLQNAIALYNGPFLNGFYSEWCQRLWTEHELKFHTALMKLAEYHAARADFSRSAELLGKVVESDNFNEEAQYRLVETYIEANEPLVALQHLRSYARLCREELGVPLPQRFANFYHRIPSHSSVA